MAVLLILMVFFCYALESNAKMQRFLEIVLIALASFRVIGVMRALFPEREPNYVINDEALTRFITGSPEMLVVLILFVGIYAAFRIATMEDKRKVAFDISKHRDRIWGVTKTAAVLVVWAALLLMILVTTGKLQIGGEDSFMYFGESWGNHRGFNWRMAARAITNASFKDLLIGVGPDCFDGAMDTYCADEVAEYWHGLSLACAHNEWLNMLVTEGVLGLVSYLGIFLLVFFRAAKRVAKEPVLMVFMACIAAYVGHNIFCYQQCECTPVIFILMGMAEMINRSVDPEKGAAE
ncbi:MAG: O-antigen ligase family protein [Lachnospiraceae bacterium]|nr:O-antigen ligase family protein [Lachnospiraceae bacterium]